jgi:hypothetical protein
MLFSYEKTITSSIVVVDAGFLYGIYCIGTVGELWAYYLGVA